MKKAAFTLIELIVVIMISAILGIWGIREYQQQKFEKEQQKFLSTLDEIMRNAVMNTTMGYVSGTGYPCSDSNDYEGITAKRTIDCVGWNNIKVDGAGTSSYIYDILRGYNTATDNKVCKIYFKEGSVNYKYYVFVDCSDINFDNQERNREYMEEKIESNIKTIFPTKYETIYRNANSIDDLISGNNKDGKIAILIKN